MGKPLKEQAYGILRAETKELLKQAKQVLDAFPDASKMKNVNLIKVSSNSYDSEKYPNSADVAQELWRWLCGLRTLLVMQKSRKLSGLSQVETQIADVKKLLERLESIAPK